MFISKNDGHTLVHITYLIICVLIINFLLRQIAQYSFGFYLRINIYLLIFLSESNSGNGPNIRIKFNQLVISCWADKKASKPENGIEDNAKTISKICLFLHDSRRTKSIGSFIVSLLCRQKSLPPTFLIYNFLWLQIWSVLILQKKFASIPKFY